MMAVKGRNLIESIAHVKMKVMSSKMKIFGQVVGILDIIVNLPDATKVSSKTSIGKNPSVNTGIGQGESGARVVKGSIAAGKRLLASAMTRITKWKELKKLGKPQRRRNKSPLPYSKTS